MQKLAERENDLSQLNAVESEADLRKKARVDEIVRLLEANNLDHWSPTFMHQTSARKHYLSLWHSEKSWSKLIGLFPKEWQDRFEIRGFETQSKSTDIPREEKEFILASIKKYIVRCLLQTLNDNQATLVNRFQKSDISKLNHSLYKQIKQLIKQSENETWFTLVRALPDPWPKKFNPSCRNLNEVAEKFTFTIEVLERDSWSFASWRAEDPDFYNTLMRFLDKEIAYKTDAVSRKKVFLGRLPDSVQAKYDSDADNRPRYQATLKSRIKTLEDWIANQKNWNPKSFQAAFPKVFGWFRSYYPIKEILDLLSDDAINKLSPDPGSILETKWLAEKIKRQIGAKIKSSWSISDIQSAEVRAEVQDAMKSGLFEKALATNLLLQWSFNPWEAR